MAERGHKRKRSLQDSTIDLGKMAAAKIRLSALKEELKGIEETNGELQAIMNHVEALDEILAYAKKPRLGFSSVKEDDLKRLGVKNGWLKFTPLLSKSIKDMDQITTSEVQALCDRIREIYAYVNMQFESGSRMIFDAILITLAKVVGKMCPGKKVAILPKMRVGPSDGVHVTNVNTGFELYLTGNVDYGVLLYDDEPENRERLLVRGGSRGDALRIARGCLFLVEDKRLKSSVLSTYIPEAVSQAIALLKAIPNTTDVRFCLSDGETWIFFVLKEEDGSFIYYESRPFQLRELALETSISEVQTIVVLVIEWLNVSPISGLYELKHLD